MRQQRKVFAYVVRRVGTDTELLVFDSLDEPGVEVPKGAVESGETLEAAVRRELLEEAGLSAIRVLDELGATRHRNEEQHFFLIEAMSELPAAFVHLVTGRGIDAGLAYAYRRPPCTKRPKRVWSRGRHVDAQGETRIPPCLAEVLPPLRRWRSEHFVAPRRRTEGLGLGDRRPGCRSEGQAEAGVETWHTGDPGTLIADYAQRSARRS